MQDQPTEVQMLIQKQAVRPLSSGLGNYRILRTSPLTPVPGTCCSDSTDYTTAN